jgi:hypothetical protein
MSLAGLKNPPVGPALTLPGAADHHCAMKSLLSVLALSAVLGFAAGCGPQEAFCPNSDGAGGVCPIIGDDASMQGMDMKGCPAGQYLGDDPSGSGGTVCLCAVGGGLPPCN